MPEGYIKLSLACPELLGYRAGLSWRSAPVRLLQLNNAPPLKNGL